MLSKFFNYTGLQLHWVNARRLDAVRLHKQKAPEVEVRVATLADCLITAQDPDLQMHEDFVRWAFSSGHICHLAWIDGVPIACAWRATTRAPHVDGWWIEVPAGWSYGYKAVTAPAYRGMGIYPALCREEARTCSDLGLIHGISLTRIDNRAAVRADHKLGSRRIGLIGHLRAGPIRKSITAGQARVLGVRLSLIPDFDFASAETDLNSDCF